MHIQLDTKRLDGNIKEAQKLLNMQVVADTEPFIPSQQGQAREQVRYPGGIYGGEIEYYAPHMHYINEGILYLTKDGRSWANKYEKKYPTDRHLQYHHPGTTDHPFEHAKAQHLQDWEKLVRDTVGKE